MTTYLGLDLGANTIRAVVGDDTGAVVGRSQRDTPAGPDGTAVVEAVEAAIREACEAGGCEPCDVVAAGIGSVGPLDLRAGAILDPVNLPGVERVDLVEPVARLLDADVRLHNDATAAAIGERFAAEDDPANLLYLTLSTGIGAGVIADGRVLRGHRGNAAEVGHVTLDPDADVRCGCGAVGHWEALCSGANLPDHARAIADRRGETALDLDDVSAAELLGAVDGDPLAADLADRVGTWNAIGVAMLVQAYDPSRVVIGGAVARNHPETILGPIRKRVPAHCLGSPPPIELTSLGDEAGVRGALASALTGGSGSRSAGPERSP